MQTDEPEDEDTPHFISPDALDFLCAQFNAYYTNPNRPIRSPTAPIASDPLTIQAWFDLSTKDRNRLRQALALTLRHFNVYIHTPPDRRDYGATNQ